MRKPAGSLQGAFPLEWPSGWKRTAPHERRRHPSFRCTFQAAAAALAQELERLRACSGVISTDIPLRLDGLPYAGAGEPKDPGVAVYFELPEKDFVASAPATRKVALACDRWNLVAHNVRALGLHVEALRGMDRWGVGSVQRAFTGYLALPAQGGSSASARPWRAVLGVSWVAWGFDVEDVIARFRELSKVVHPDVKGGSAAAWAELTAAKAEALEELAQLEKVEEARGLR